MRASDVIQALRDSGALHQTDPEWLDGARSRLMEQTAKWSGMWRDPELLARLGDLGDNLRWSVEWLLNGVGDDARRAALADPTKFGFAVEDLNGRLNARAFAVGGAWLALVDKTLMTTLFATAHASAGLFPIGDGHDVVCETCGSHECESESIATSARRWFEAGLHAHRHTNQPTEGWEASESATRAANAITVNGHSYIVAHEIGHHLLGHTGEAHVTDVLEMGSQGSIRERHTSWDMELAADQEATGLMINAAIGAPPDLLKAPSPIVLAALGIEHVWGTLELLECTARHPVNYRTHPPVALRRHFVDRAYGADAVLEQMRQASAWYRGLHQQMWATLGAPNRHDVEGWEMEREYIEAQIAHGLAQACSLMPAPTVEDLGPIFTDLERIRWESSKLFFDAALSRIARAEPRSSKLGTAARLAWHVLCDLPEHLTRNVDHTAPFLGLPLREPEIPFAAIARPRNQSA